MVLTPERKALIQAQFKLMGLRDNAAAREAAIQEMEASEYPSVRMAAEKIRLPHVNEDGTYINLPADFPYKSHAELEAVDFLKGVEFVYHSKYGGQLTMPIRNALVRMNYGLNENKKLYLKASEVVLISENGCSYDWEDCELLLN